MKTVISKDGTTIAYDQTGQGTPLVTVGGAMGWRKFSGAVELAELLAPHFTVINYDRRGRGDSTDTKPYAMQREIEDIEALIAAAGGQASLYGMSSGAALALHAAASGLNIKKLALYEPPFVGVDKSEYQPPQDYREHTQALIDADQRSAAVHYFMCKVIGMPSVMGWVMRFMPMWKDLKSTAHTLPYDMAIMNGFDLPTAAAAKINTPTIVIGGEKSPASLRKAVSATADVIPNAQRKFLAKQSHNVSMKVLAPALIEFFQVS
ncbi:MAG: alpha/beta hydrolase [Nitrosomonadales bacterium]|nr:alpha/beta hydrolase [Nitrosomonadales bacterium]